MKRHPQGCSAALHCLRYNSVLILIIFKQAVLLFVQFYVVFTCWRTFTWLEIDCATMFHSGVQDACLWGRQLRLFKFMHSKNQLIGMALSLNVFIYIYNVTPAFHEELCEGAKPVQNHRVSQRNIVSVTPPVGFWRVILCPLWVGPPLPSWQCLTLPNSQLIQIQWRRWRENGAEQSLFAETRPSKSNKVILPNHFLIS